MATPSAFQITLSFKAVMDGLNTFVSGYKSRMAEVEAFNQRITAGGASLQRMFGQVGVVLGGAAFLKYARDAAAADIVQQQLVRTLQRVGETGALQALNAQAIALQRVTLFSDEAVTTVQRLLISSGLSAAQTQDLTEQVLDFAQETGQAAESAAALIARSFRGQTDELGRYNIKLDTSKGMVDALGEALTRYAAGAARGAVANTVARENSERFSEATEDLGRAVNRMLTPFLERLVPLVEWLATAGTRLATTFAPIAPAVGELALKLLAVVGAFLIFKMAVGALMLVLNPLRLMIVFLSGVSFVALNNILAASTASMGAMSTAAVVLKGALTSWAGAGKLAAIAFSLVGAALVGWQLGTFIGEIHAGGRAIKDWVAIAIVWVGDKLGGIWLGLRKAWAVTKAAGEDFWGALKFATLAGVIAILNAWNKLPFWQDWKVDLSPLRAEFDATAQHLAGSAGRLRAALQGIDLERARQKKESAELIELLKLSGAPAGAGIAGTAPADLPAAKDIDAGIEQAELFALQTQLLQAQLAGNQAEMDRLTNLLEEKKLKEELIKLEERAGPLVVARLAVQTAIRAQDRAAMAEELALQQALGALEIRRADIEANRLLSEQQKQAAVNLLLAETNTLIAEKLALNEAALKAGVTDQEKMRLLQEIDSLRKELADNRRTQESTRALTMGEGVMAGGKSFMGSLATAAQNAADAVQGTLNTALQSTGDLLYNLATGAMSFKQAWGQATMQVGQQFLRMATDMVAKMLWRATVERALTALGITLHVTGEAAKTAATTTGVGTRMMTKIKEVLADVYAGAVAAFKALAGIPFVGPFLAAAALAAALALGIGLVSKIGRAKGGLIAGPGSGTSDSIPAMLSAGEYVVRASAVDRFGPDFFAALNAGALDLGALPDNIARHSAGQQNAAAASPASGGGAAAPARDRRIIMVAPDRVSARQLARDPEFENVIVDVMRRRRGEIIDS